VLTTKSEKEAVGLFDKSLKGTLMSTACRFCGAAAHIVMADLGMQPLSNALRGPQEIYSMERFYPLQAVVCESCLLVQAPNYESAEEIFSAKYPYFSSYSDTWLAHAKAYAEAMMARFDLGRSSRVVEIACNDGYLLRWFLACGVPVLGIEPTAGTAEVAAALGIPVQQKFFGRQLGIELREQGFSADLMPANNVVAHVPDINDFVAGFTELLKPSGVATFEFHHLLNLIQLRQFDTIYHEHFYYHSLSTFKKILEHNGLSVFDVEELPTHGGSLRVYAQRSDQGLHAVSKRVHSLLDREREAGLTDISTYLAFNDQIKTMKRRMLSFLIAAKDEGKTICGVGAPAKGNTLLNYLGVRNDFLEYTVDHNPHKQGLYLPGTTIPVKSPDQIFQDKPDYVLILPWNWADELRGKLAGIGAWGGKFVVLNPDITIIDDPVHAS
jgi:SAM-dependent methyltransferase